METAKYSAEYKTFTPSFIYPFATLGFGAVTQILVLIKGQAIPDRVKVQFTFLTNAVIIVVLPFLAHEPSSDATKFWSCFWLLFIFGGLNGVC